MPTALGPVVPPAVRILRHFLRDVRGVQAAFVYGSTAKGTRRPDSDVDVFVLENVDVDRRTLLRRMAEAEVLLRVEINAMRYTPQALAERLNNPEHPAARFVRGVLSGPKHWVSGDPECLRSLAAHAGVQIGEFAQ